MFNTYYTLFQKLKSNTSGDTNKTEVIIWYSSLILVLILFYLFVKIRSKKNNGLFKMQIKLGREITRIESIKKNLKSENKIKDNFTKTYLLLKSFEGVLIDLNEKTILSDISDAIKLIDSVTKKMKKVDTTDFKKYNDSLDKILVDLSKLNSLLATIRSVLKK